MIPKFVEYETASKAMPDKAMPQQMRYLLNEIEKTPDHHFDGSKYPLVTANIFTKVWVLVSDPEVASDLYNKHNKWIDKCDDSARSFDALLGSSLLFGPTDEDWRRKRKACSHAFYKDRLHHMLEVLKGKINQRVDAWNNEIEASTTGSTNINMALVFEETFADNLIHIAFGESLAGEKLEVDYLLDKDTRKTEKRTLGIRDALTNTFTLVEMSTLARFEDPISMIAFFTFDISLDRHPFCQLARANATIVRNYMQEYITKRKEGKVKSTVKDVDMLSLFLESPDIFTDEFIIDELMDFFLAGTLTT